ncbi:DUF4124 domain-containing protein [Pseudoxanthomonas koreensis]|uniref:DUF4124 domain-containing protein n=1 Tax=Pseudoxanthomonas koreensis TaxID=266061 RepID=UPI0013917ADB|nr:DUF4124 domain-containing protein [Pseudoxanthomonas koreensis]KAF1697146.1 hypothetical protein CSC64_01340 [Pseudoxanthomonas koreensis]
MHPRLRLSPLCLLLCLLMGTATPATLRAQAVTIYRCTDAAGVLTVQNAPCPDGSTQSERRMGGVASSPDAGAAATGPALTAPPPTGTPPSAAPAGQVQDVQRSSDGGFVTTSTGPGTSVDRHAPQRHASDGGFITTSTGPEPRILDSANLPRADAAAGEAGESDPARPPPPPIFRCTTHDNDSYLSEEAEVPPRCLPLRTVGLDGNPATGAGRACEVGRARCSRVPDGAACEAWRRHAREAESRWRFAHPDNTERRRTEYDRLAALVSESCGAP